MSLVYPANICFGAYEDASPEFLKLGLGNRLANRSPSDHPQSIADIVVNYSKPTTLLKATSLSISLWVATT
jgi:hypothetical protein